MRRILSLIIISAVAIPLFGTLFAQKRDAEQPQEESKVIDLTADIVYPLKLNDTVEVMCLVGNFAAQHNGAIITADSAVRYNDKRLECFGDVLINKNTTYAYADRADYNGDINEVSLYAPIIKVVDGDATLYCYNFSFNTLDNIGFYVGGGVMVNGTNVMESVTGYYYSDTKELIGVGDVELSGDEYEMKSDSIIYNTESESARYFENTDIWNENDEYLSADAGDYDKLLDRYSFSLNGYILTNEQEMWSDSMDYFRASEHIYMRQNIQIDDTTHKSLIFGDYGEYIKNPGDMILVGRPSIINYDAEQGDSLYMRADTFQIFTLNRFEPADSVNIESASDAAEELIDEIRQEKAAAKQSDDMHAGEHHDHDAHDHAHDHDHEANAASGEESPATSKSEVGRDRAQTPPQGPPASGAGPRVNVGSSKIGVPNDSLERSVVQRSQADSIAADSVVVDSLAADSLAVDSLVLDSLARAADTLNFWQKTVANYKEAQAVRAAKRAEEAVARKIILDSIGKARQIIINEKLDAEAVREARRVAQRKAKMAEREAKKIRRDVARGKIKAEDTVALMAGIAVDTTALIQELAPKQSVVSDSLAVDSLARDSLAVDSLAADSVAVDSLYRLTKGYRNVKIYRTDFQAVADSMVTSSLDSIIRLYLNPILWHDANQVTSDIMDIYTDNNQIKKAIFTGGTPIMASEITPYVYYNQVAGKVITSLFAEGAVYRNDVDGNAQTIYFMQDDKTQEVNGLMTMESGSATFYIEDQTVVGITYRTEPDYILYPLSKVPADQSLSLKGFEWHGERRPTREQVFDRAIRPSVREEKSALSRPQFPIKEALDAHRKDLIESGEWLDRNDLVAPRAEAWMESLGFKTGQPREE